MYQQADSSLNRFFCDPNLEYFSNIIDRASKVKLRNTFERWAEVKHAQCKLIQQHIRLFGRSANWTAHWGISLQIRYEVKKWNQIFKEKIFQLVVLDQIRIALFCPDAKHLNRKRLLDSYYIFVVENLKHRGEAELRNTLWLVSWDPRSRKIFGIRPKVWLTLSDRIHQLLSKSLFEKRKWDKYLSKSRNFKMSIISSGYAIISRPLAELE